MNSTTDNAQTGAAIPEPTEDLTLFEPPAALDTPTDLLEVSPRRCVSSPTASARTHLVPELRPARRLLDAGPEALSGSELLSILIGGEPARALQLAGDVISARGGLAGLRAASYHDLLDGDTLSERRAATIAAAVELGKRLSSATGPERPIISSAEDVNALLAPRLRDLDREHFVVVLLDAKNHVLATPTVSVGTLLASLVHPREVFKPAIKASAASLVLAHNHPSGQVQPSAEDRSVTNQIVEAGKLIRIEVLDHVIIGAGGYLSLKEQGML